MYAYGQQDEGAYGGYGGAAHQRQGHVPLADDSKRVLMRGPRRSLNVVPLIFALMVPCGLFLLVSWCLMFQFHYNNQPLCITVVVLCYLCALIFGFITVQARWRTRTSLREPSWVTFMCVTGLVACILGTMAGQFTYMGHMHGYYDMTNLNVYLAVNPLVLRGQQLMDAGRVEFTEGTHLDIKRSMGFKNDDMYCVAPIKMGNTESVMTTYDFWAVGKNCCSGLTADFHCAAFADANARSGLRLMIDKDRPYYRLAVQQAEATYHIRAEHPLFFEWTEDALGTMNDWKHVGHREFVSFMAGHFLLQLFLVVAASLAFSKVGRL